MIIMPPIYVVSIKAIQYQIEPGSTERDTQIDRDREPVPRRTVVITVQDIIETISGPVRQFGPEQDIARRKSPPKVTADHRFTNPVLPVNLGNEPLLVKRRIVIYIETIPVNIIVIMGIIFRIQVKINVDIDSLGGRQRNPQRGH